ELRSDIGLAQEAVEVLLRRPLCVVDDPAPVEAAVDADRDETGLAPDRAFRGIGECLHQFGLRRGPDLVHVDQSKMPGPGVDRRCHAVGHSLALRKSASRRDDRNALPTVTYDAARGGRPQRYLSCLYRLMNPSSLHASLPTPWWTKNSPSGS